MRLDAPCTTRKEAVILLGTEVPVEGDTVPVKTTVKGTIMTWNHRPGERTLSGGPVIIYEGDPLCVIYYIGADRIPSIELVGAPIKGLLVKIIKEAGDVEEGETIGEMEPVHDVPPGILDRYDPFSIG